MKIMINCPDDVNAHDLTRSLVRILFSNNEMRKQRGEEVLICFDDSPDRKHQGGINIVVRRDDVDDAEIMKDMNRLENLTKRFKSPRSPKPKTSGII